MSIGRIVTILTIAYIVLSFVVAGIYDSPV